MFGRNKKIKETLTEEQQNLIDEARSLVEETRQTAKKQGVDNMTSRLMLRDDCQLVEQSIKKLMTTPNPDNIEKLKNAIIRLQTSSENILK